MTQPDPAVVDDPEGFVPPGDALLLRWVELAHTLPDLTGHARVELITETLVYLVEQETQGRFG